MPDSFVQLFIFIFKAHILTIWQFTNIHSLNAVAVICHLIPLPDTASFPGRDLKERDEFCGKEPTRECDKYSFFIVMTGVLLCVSLFVFVVSIWALIVSAVALKRKKACNMDCSCNVDCTECTRCCAKCCDYLFT